MNQKEYASFKADKVKPKYAQFALDAAYYEFLKRLAVDEHITISALIRRALYARYPELKTENK
jgi:hypothetical protein